MSVSFQCDIQSAIVIGFGFTPCAIEPLFIRQRAPRVLLRGENLRVQLWQCFSVRKRQRAVEIG
ncbi:MAG: hypothetical protein HDKAJFGB_01471 [Anaerolineae bacterium]|nr:hypothetical protein [Anaerolineae bacterium]